MRAVVQRVSHASVTIGNQVHAATGPGLLVLLGIHRDDDETLAVWMAGKLARLRIFEDAEGIMNRSLLDTGGEALVVSQFTLLANHRKGNRPSFNDAARPETAIPLYERCVRELESLLGRTVATGVFGARMEIALCNDGPVTLVIDSNGG
ncbi:MAG: D-aminoacyl-tRNA deacylase [Opitutaceae bacterium]